MLCNNKEYIILLFFIPFLKTTAAYAETYKIKFGRMIKISKKNIETIYIKNKFKFISIPIKIYGNEIILATKGGQTFLKSKSDIFFKFPFIKGKCKRLKGTLKPIKVTFFNCKLTTQLKNDVKIYAYANKIYFKRPFSALILQHSDVTTCSYPVPHYKIGVEKLYLILSKDTHKYNIEKIYIKNMKNILVIPFTGFRKSFFIVKEGQQKKVTFRGLNFFNRNRFRKVLTLYFTNILYLSKNSFVDFNFYPSYSTKRGFFVEYSHTLTTPVIKEKTDFFYLNDNIKKPSDSFDSFFFPPITRNRFFYHSYGDVYTKYFSTKYEIYKLSDANLLQELFPYKFKNEKQPETYLNIQKFLQSNIYIRIFTKPNINNFLVQTEYLPLTKIGLLNINLTNKLHMTLISTAGYLVRNNSLPLAQSNDTRLTIKNIFTYSLPNNYFNINLYGGWMANIYNNNTLNDKFSAVGGLGIIKTLSHTSTNYSYWGLFETKYIHSDNFTNKPNNAQFFDKEDIFAKTGELYFSLKNNILFKHFEIEYNIYQELHTQKVDIANQSSFFPFELPTNSSAASARRSNHIQNIKFKINEFTLAARYENSGSKLLTTTPYLLSLYGEYRHKNKFIVQTIYNKSQDIVNSLGIYSALQLSSQYYTSIYINYYFNEHRIINNILTLTRDFHDFYFNIGFSRDVLRKEILFSISLEPKLGGKDILEKKAQKYYLRR